MELSKAFDDKQNKLVNDISVGPGMHQLEESLRTSKVAYPWAPGSNISREDQGGAGDLIDVQSELNNLSRPLTKDISKEYSPFTAQQFNKPIYGKGQYFDQVNSRISDPAFDLKEFGINRWEHLQINPQDNCIEPFRRLGVNTVLDTLDKHSKCELPTK